MRDLILKTLRESVKAYPELKGYLSDEALILTWVKVGEAPDDKVRLRDERLLKRKLTKFLEGQKSRILTYIRTHDMKAIQPSFWDDEIQKMWAELGEDFVGIMLHGVEGGIDILPGHGTGFAIDQDKINMRLVNYAKQYRDKWLEKIEDTSRGYVDQHITNWLLSGDPLSVLINALKEDTTGMFKEPRATRIAVTETTRLHALGNKMAWEETDYIKKWKWMTAQDELVCDICREGNAGGPYPLSQLDEKLPAHVNCRCWSQPIVEVGEGEETWDHDGEPLVENIIGNIEDLTGLRFSFENAFTGNTEYNGLYRLDAEALKNLYDQLKTIYTKYPGMKDYVQDIDMTKYTGTEKHIIAAWSHQYHTVTLNELYYGNLEKFKEIYEGQVNQNFHPVGTNSDSVIMHEMGHAIDDYISQKTNSNFSLDVLKTITNEFNMNSKEDYANSISVYATLNNKEFLAESFAEYMTSPTPRPVAMRVGEIIENTYAGIE
jgi:SPP1 gp7 family putative phage head morphogenesis protein